MRKSITPKPELDLTSKYFDAEKALSEPESNVNIPVPNATIYDNISCFVETEEGIFPRERKIPASKQQKVNVPNPTASTSSTTEKQTEEETKKTRKKLKNVLTRMDNTVKGPLAFLKKCMDEKLRIKVYTRGPVNIRGSCVGFLEAFDKHWNLVLKDVFETWMRRRRRQNELEDGKEIIKLDIGANEPKSNVDTTNKFKKNPSKDRRTPQTSTDHVLDKPKIVVRKRLKRKEFCERHVDQLFIRGEQIVLVTLQ